MNHSLVTKNVARQPGVDDTNPAQGGGIFNFGELTLERSSVTHNTATAPVDGDSAEGGGICNYLGANLTVRESVVSNNTASSSNQTLLGGGAKGGGMVIYSTATVDTSVIRDNIAIASGSPGAPVDGEGGGIDVQGTLTLDHTLVFSNSAIASNSAIPNAAFIARAGGGGLGVFGKAILIHTDVHCNTAHAPAGVAQGGGIDNGSIGTATLDYSEVVENKAVGDTAADSLGGGIYNGNAASGSVTLHESKVKDNHPDQCDPTGSVPGCTN